MRAFTASLRRAIGATGLAALLVAALAAPALAAAPTHQFLLSIQGEIKEPGHIPLPPPEGELEDACGVALDSAGNVYISDYYHRTVDVYGPSGGSQPGPYLTQISDPEPGGPCNLAVDAAGDVFVNQWRGGVLELKPSEFPPSEETSYGPATAIDPAHTARATGIATDAAGNLYVDEGSAIARYDAPLGPGSEAAEEIGLGTLGSGYGLALSTYPATAGYLYVADAASDTVKVYDPATEPAAPIAEIDGAGAPGGGFASLLDSALAVDPTDGHLFVAENLQPGEERPAAAVDEFNSSGAYRGRLPGSFIDAEPTALAVDPKGNVYASSGNSEGAVVDVFGPTEAAHTLKVEKSGEGKGTVTSEPAGIRCGSACTAEYNAGTEVFLTAIPDSHSSFGGWSGCLRTSGARCTVQLSADRAPSAAFDAIPQQTLTLTKGGSGTGTVVSEPAGIDCAAACPGQEAQFNEGAEVTLTATAPLGSAFAGWSGTCTGTGACKVTMSAARSVKAEFEAVPTHGLTVATGGEGAGTVSSEPAGIDCGESCAAQFNAGTEVTLTATPAPGSRFAGFSGGGCSGNGACTVTLAADESLSATFVPISYTLSLSGTGNGAGTVSSEPAGIDCGESCAAQFNAGTEVTLTATPAPGSRFAGFSGGGCPASGACHLVLGADTQVSASFVLVYPTLAVVRTGSGQGVVLSEPPGAIACGVLCAAVFDRGYSLTLIAAPLPGSRFAGWSGCDSAVGNRCTVVLGTDRTVSAAFAALTLSPLPHLSLGKLSVKGTGATLELEVSGPGTVRAAGRNLKSALASRAAAGPFLMHLALSAAGRRALRRSGRGGLQVLATLSFRPSKSAAAVIVKRLLSFGSKSHRAKKRHRRRHRHHQPRPRGEAVLTQRGDLFASFNGGISPAALPRHKLTPIAISIDANIASLSAKNPPAVRRVSIAVNGHGHLDTRGLPICRERQIEGSSSAQALLACRGALVGEGTSVVGTAFPEQVTSTSRGRILAFNSTLEGHQAILADVFSKAPVPVTHIVVFHVRHTRGRFGTLLTASLSAKANPYGYLKRIELNLYRRFKFRGRLHSYLSAACAAPPGFRSAVFPFARTSMTFADGRTLASTIDRSCRVSE